MLEYFTGCSPEPQDYTPELSQKGLNLLQMFKEMLIASGKYAPHTRRSIPATVPVKVFLTPAAAGSGSFLNGEDYEMIDFNPNNVPEGTDFGIRVSGDSVLPRYVSGQIVFVEQCKELYPGRSVCLYITETHISSNIRKQCRKTPIRRSPCFPLTGIWQTVMFM